MAKNNRHICVFDFESDGTDPHTCNPTQIAAIMLDPNTLDPVKGAEFCSDMKPEGIDDLNTYLTKEREETIAWHANNQGTTVEEVIKRWQESPLTKTVWAQFSSFVNEFNWKKTAWSGPIAAGANIRDYDLIIADRLNTKYKIKYMFFRRDKVDVQDLCFYWFEGYQYGPENFKMDTLRKYFGISGDNAHDALKDVHDEALLISKFLKLHRNAFAKCSGLHSEEEK